MTTRLALRTAIENYHTAFQQEKNCQVRFIELLNHPRAFFRDHLPGHITGSAWIIDPSKKFVLLTHHAKLDRWLQPGGHADGDENVLNVAMREAREETGLTTLILKQNSIFDIDIHTIPARPDFQQHDHYDVRFLFQASRDEPLIISEESHDLAWKNTDDLSKLTGSDLSMLRLAEKIKMLS